MKPSDHQNHPFVDFLEKENRKLIRYINSYLDDRVGDYEAEDVLQEVSLNLVMRADFSGEVGNIAAYIYRAVRNKITDLYRRKKYTVSVEQFNNQKNENTLLNSLQASQEEDPVIYHNENLQQKLLQAIEKLNPAERELLRKTEFEDYTFQELAAEWNIPIGTLLARKHRAMGKLRKMLQDDFTMFNHKNN